MGDEDGRGPEGRGDGMEVRGMAQGFITFMVRVVIYIHIGFARSKIWNDRSLVRHQTLSPSLGSIRSGHDHFGAPNLEGGGVVRFRSRRKAPDLDSDL